MASFEDLSVYSYGGEAEVGVLNVGWLGSDASYPRGECDRRVRDLLLLRALDPEVVMRGLHYCELCDEESPIRVEVPGQVRLAVLGVGEIRIVSGDAIYAAPTLVVHYIDAHGYTPPEEFCRAVLAIYTSP